MYNYIYSLVGCDAVEFGTEACKVQRKLLPCSRAETSSAMKVKTARPYKLLVPDNTVSNPRITWY